MTRDQTRSKAVGALAALSLTLACGGGEPMTDSSASDGAQSVQSVQTVRIATFNIWELGRDKLDRQGADGRYDHPQLSSAAEVIQRLRPDVLLLNEIDFDAERRENARLFVERFLKVSQGGQEPIDYPEIFFEPSNTGVPTGHDLDNDGRSDGPADAYGFGRYPGQYAMALLSRLPIDRENARTFQKLLWRGVPDNLMPDGTGGKPAFYDAGEVEILRLSSKSHWDVPVRAGGAVVHLLASHPTPPVFDGEEDHNGRRNFDEVRLWADYLTGGEAAAYLVDDAGRPGGLAPEAHFVVLGDLNADPTNRESVYRGRTAISQLLEHPRVQDPRPASAGAAAVDRPYDGPGELRTAPYGRIDYVLPSRSLEVRGTGVFWPGPGDPLRRLVEGEARASDHALVWVDVGVPAR